MPVTVDCNPAVAGADRRLQAASVSGSLQGSVQLAFDHGLDEAGFRKLVLVLLLVSGIALVAPALTPLFG